MFKFSYEQFNAINQRLNDRFQSFCHCAPKEIEFIKFDEKTINIICTGVEFRALNRETGKATAIMHTLVFKVYNDPESVLGIKTHEQSPPIEVNFLDETALKKVG